jgi:hypothetical protein
MHFTNIVSLATLVALVIAIPVPEADRVQYRHVHPVEERSWDAATNAVPVHNADEVVKRGYEYVHPVVGKVNKRSYGTVTNGMLSLHSLSSLNRDWKSGRHFRSRQTPFLPIDL